MAPIALALFEAILGRSLHMSACIYICVYIYRYIYIYLCTEQQHIHCIISKKVSNHPQKIGVKPFQRLELLRHLDLGTVVSQTPHSSSMITTMPCHYSHPYVYNYVSIPGLLSALVPVPQSKDKGWGFSHYQILPGSHQEGDHSLLWVNSCHSPGSSPARVLVPCVLTFPRLCWQEQLFPPIAVLLVQTLIPPCPYIPTTFCLTAAALWQPQQEVLRMKDLQEFMLTWGWQKHTTSEANSVLWA